MSTSPPVEGQPQPTTLTQPQHTVNLDEPFLPKFLLGGTILGIFMLAAQRLREPRSSAPDAAEELALEVQQIQQRNLQRRRTRRQAT